MLIVKAFKKASGEYMVCLVFVIPETLKVRTYFLKDLNALDKAWKGFSVQIFEQKKMVLINVDARQAEPSGLSRTRHHRRPEINVPPFCEKSSTLKKNLPCLPRQTCRTTFDNKKFKLFLIRSSNRFIQYPWQAGPTKKVLDFSTNAGILFIMVARWCKQIEAFSLNLGAAQRLRVSAGSYPAKATWCTLFFCDENGVIFEWFFMRNSEKFLTRLWRCRQNSKVFLLIAARLISKEVKQAK